MKHYFKKSMGAICLSNEITKAHYIKEVNCPNCKALLKHLESILGKLMAEGVHFLDTEGSIKVLKTCVAPSFLLEIYQNFQYELRVIAEENLEDAKDELLIAIRKQFQSGPDIFLPDYLVKEKEFNVDTKIAHEKYMDAREYSTNPYAWKLHLNEKFRAMIRS